MATLIEKLWRCKSANGGRQNNCPPTGPPHPHPQKREFRFKRVSEGKKKKASKKDIHSAFTQMMLSFSESQRWWQKRRRWVGAARLGC